MLLSLCEMMFTSCNHLYNGHWGCHHADHNPGKMNSHGEQDQHYCGCGFHVAQDLYLRIGDILFFGKGDYSTSSWQTG
jgi:hypothetical protein